MSDCPELFFLPSVAGNLLATHFPPDPSAPPRGSVLLLPPFAEEMNRCRRIVATQARLLARRGWRVLTVDLYGTGESDGELADAGLDIWRQDIARALAWLEAGHGGPVTLWGIRFGALLTGAALESGHDIAGLLLWDPLEDGSAMLDQFLRVRVVASVFKGPVRESISGLRARLAAGETLEVAGYALSPSLAADIDGLAAAPAPPAAGFLVRVDTRSPRRNDGGEAAPWCRPAYWEPHEHALCHRLLKHTTREMLHARAAVS